MTDRIPCCIPFCRRTAARDKWPGAVEWICGRHWPHAPMMLRRLHQRIRRRARTGRYVDAAIAGRVWNRIKAAVIHAA